MNIMDLDLDLLHVEADARDDARIQDCEDRTGHEDVRWLDVMLDGDEWRHEGSCVDCGVQVAGYTKSKHEFPTEWRS